MLLCVNGKNFRTAGLGGLGFGVPRFSLLIIGSVLQIFCIVLKSEPLAMFEFVYPNEMFKVSNRYWKAQILKLILIR